MKEKYLIGHVSQILNISKDTLRYYDKLGIVSPKKDSNNNYRYYTLEDLLTLSYVLVFKDLGIPLGEIKQLIQHNTLDDFTLLLDKQQSLIDTKINSLFNLKKKVLSFKHHIQSVHTYKNHIHVTMSPPFVYQSTRKEWDAHYAGYLIEMESNKYIDAPIYSILVSNNFLEIPEEEVTFVHGISGIVNDMTALDTLSQYTYISPKRCIHTVVSATEALYKKGPKALQDYIATHKLTLKGDILARNIAFEHVDESPIDYFELWLPIE